MNKTRSILGAAFAASLVWFFCGATADMLYGIFVTSGFTAIFLNE